MALQITPCLIIRIERVIKQFKVLGILVIVSLLTVLFRSIVFMADFGE